MQRSKTVNSFIDAHPDWRPAIEKLRNIILTTELTETFKWGAPTYTIDNKNVVGIGAFKSYVGLWFFNGSLLKDANKKLINAQAGKTKAMRQWRFSEAKDIKSNQILPYLKEAIALQKAGKVVPKTSSQTKLEIPIELQTALDQDEALAGQFAALTPYKRKEYAEHIGAAKRESTRQSRLQKCIPMILKGIGLNDKYRSC
ncbi:hypothetical protein FLL45_07185 [Aliikangiella marina]|uniref:YdhG-like domain-containing protein n=1 Tax=Aliikangiella marina TaxID=1712262 RepID=A0A545TBY8_9GAMM|nr:DUF1801 domain-containing protein [Aliikangiella marina]TQV74738.1 hypothetical protein FLL45_07185 [Aliikangiella marina]